MKLAFHRPERKTPRYLYSFVSFSTWLPMCQFLSDTLLPITITCDLSELSFRFHPSANVFVIFKSVSRVSELLAIWTISSAKNRLLIILLANGTSNPDFIKSDVSSSFISTLKSGTLHTLASARSSDSKSPKKYVICYIFVRSLLLTAIFCLLYHVSIINRIFRLSNPIRWAFDIFKNAR